VSEETRSEETRSEETRNDALLPEWLDAALIAVNETSAPRGDDIVAAVLDLARDAAHGVMRPAAPLATFALGLAAARDPQPEAIVDAARAIANVALSWNETASE